MTSPVIQETHVMVQGLEIPVGKQATRARRSSYYTGRAGVAVIGQSSC